MDVVIRPGDVGNYASAEQAIGYQKALEVKEQVMKVAHLMIPLDGKKDVDLNGNRMGDVVIISQHLEGDEAHTYTGRLQFKPVTREVESLDVERVGIDDPKDRERLKFEQGYHLTLGRILKAILSHVCLSPCGHFLKDPYDKETYELRLKDKEISSYNPRHEIRKVTEDKRTGSLHYEEWDASYYPI